jgi:integrase
MPTPKMKAMGFQPVSLGLHGPEAKAIAYQWEARYQRARRGEDPTPGQFYPPDSVGDGFARFKRSNEWKRKPPRTKEDWERGWRMIEPVFGRDAPSTITFEHLDLWYSRLCSLKGEGEAGRAMKTWRALYKVLASMKLCVAGQDPSLSIRKKAVAGRTETWREYEIVRLVKDAWRNGYCGLACIIAVAWDTGFSPVDARTLTPSQAVTSGQDMAFLIQRGKTGEPAIGTLSRRAQRLVEAYVRSMPYDLHDDAPIFRTKGYAPTAKGGRPRNSVPYTKDSLVSDFADARKRVFGSDDKRRLMDARRSGAVEANAGGASVESLAAKMGNSIDENKKLQATYMPVNIAAVRAADDARRIGRKKLGEEQNQFKKLKLGSGES